MKKLLTPAQVVAFLAPYIAVASGALASWLLVNLKFLGIFGTQTTLAKDLSALGTFALVAGLTWASHHFHWVPLAKAALGAPDRT